MNKKVIMTNCFNELRDCLECAIDHYEAWNVISWGNSKEHLMFMLNFTQILLPNIKLINDMLALFNHDDFISIFNNSEVYEAFAVKWGIIKAVVDNKAFTNRRYNKLVDMLNYKYKPQFLDLGYGIAVLKALNPKWRNKYDRK